LFEQQWALAQTQVAKGGIQLNAVAVLFFNAVPNNTPPDARAFEVKPCGLKIISKQDVPAAELNVLPHCLHCPYTDPTRIIHCGGSPTGYCNAYTNSDWDIVVPASTPENAEWELLIAILRQLGYNVAGM
jgi:hypothetical protein